MAYGHSMSKKHAFNQRSFVRNYWRPYWGDDTCIEDLTKPELDDFFYYLYREVGLKTTKNKDTRDLPIDHQTILQLMNHARTNPKFVDLSYVFYQPQNPSKAYYPGFYNDIFYLALDKIGIHEAERKDRNIVFHCLRHFCATLLAQRTDLKTVQTILGHVMQGCSTGMKELVIMALILQKKLKKEILAERVERRKRQMEMLNGFDELVVKRLKTLNPDDLNADGAMDLLERSVKLDSFITGADKENANPVDFLVKLGFS